MKRPKTGQKSAKYHETAKRPHFFKNGGHVVQPAKIANFGRLAGAFGNTGFKVNPSYQPIQ